MLKNQYNEKSSTVEECEQIIREQKAEAANTHAQWGKKKIKSVLEIEKLDKTLQSLHLDVIASQQKHKVELAQLEQQITQLERDFTDARKLYSQKNHQVCFCYENEQTSYLFRNHIAKQNVKEQSMHCFIHICYELQRKTYFITNFVSTYFSGVCL